MGQSKYDSASRSDRGSAYTILYRRNPWCAAASLTAFDVHFRLDLPGLACLLELALLLAGRHVYR